MEHAPRKTWGGQYYLNVALALVAAAFFTVACTGHDISTDSFSDEPVVAAVEEVAGEGLTFEEFLQFQEKWGDGCYIFEQDVVVCNEEEMRHLYHKSGASGDLALSAHAYNEKAMQWDEDERRRLTYCVDKKTFDTGWAMRNRPESEGGTLTCTADDAANRDQQSASNFALDNPGLRWSLQKGESCTSGSQCASGSCSAGKCNDCVGNQQCVGSTARDCTQHSECMSGSCGVTAPGICDACTTAAACGLCPAGEACFNGRPFLGIYDKAKQAMQQTADEWARHIGVEFVYVGDEIDPRTGKTIDEESCNPADYPMYHAGSDTDTYVNGLWPEDYPLFFVRPMYAMFQDAESWQAYRDAWGDSPFRFDGTCTPINALAFFPWYLKHYYIGNPEEEKYAWGGGFMNRTLGINTGLQLPSWYPYGDRDVDTSCPTCVDCHEVAIEMAMTTWPDGDGGFGPNCETIPRKACTQDSDCFSYNCGTDGYCNPGLPLYGYYKADTCPKCPTASELNDPEVCMNANYRDMDMFAFSCDGYGGHPGTYPDLGYTVNDLRGLLLHETGHILGLTHSHGTAGYMACPEFNEIYDNDLDLRMDDRRIDVTVYDPASTMHYPWCYGTGDYSLSPLDVCGTQVLYPPDEGDLGKGASGYMTGLTYVNGFLSDDADKDGWRDFCDEAGGNTHTIGKLDPSVDPEESPVGILHDRVYNGIGFEIDITDPVAGKDGIASLLVVAGTRFKVRAEPYTPATSGCSTPTMELIVGPDWGEMSFIPSPSGWAWSLVGNVTSGCTRNGNIAECDVVVPGTPGDYVNATALFRPTVSTCTDYKISFWYVEPCGSDIDGDGICDGLDGGFGTQGGTVGVDHTFDGNYVDLPDWPVQEALSVTAYNYFYEPAANPPYQQTYPLGCHDIVDDVYVMADIGITADCSDAEDGYLADTCNDQMYATYDEPYCLSSNPSCTANFAGKTVVLMWDGKAIRLPATDHNGLHEQICFTARYGHRQGPTSGYTEEQWLENVQTLTASYAANVKTWRECADPNDTCMWDLDGDGTVGAADEAIRLACEQNEGTDPKMACRLADFDCDGTVGWTDRTAMMAKYGSCAGTCDGPDMAQDPVTGLCWQAAADAVYVHQSLNYCSALQTGGFTDWRLPTIDELRTLVGGCSNMEYGGACELSDPSCLDYDTCIGSCVNCVAGNYGRLGLVYDGYEWISASKLDAPYAAYTWSLRYDLATWGAKPDTFAGAARCVRGIFDAQCPDVDSDGVCDAQDICTGYDDGVDADSDGVPDGCDNCPGEDDALDIDPANGTPDCLEVPAGGGEQTDELSGSTPADTFVDHVYDVEPGTNFSVTIDATAGAGFFFVQWDQRGGFGFAQCDKFLSSGGTESCTLSVPGSGVSQAYVSVKGTASGISYDLSVTYTPEGGGACTDTDGDSECDEDELCDNDPNKTVPGICGCGMADIDNDLDGTYVCHGDQCDNDVNKTLPGVCGCGVADVDGDRDGTYVCQGDLCDSDPLKTVPGECGCGVPEGTCGSSCTGPNVFEDASNSRCWQYNSAGAYTYASAQSYCSSLNLDGYDDWRLPTIDELRMTVSSSCSVNTYGGSCGVTDPTCLATSCGSNCNTCSGPVLINGLIGTTESVWTSSEDPGTGNKWTIRFYNAFMWPKTSTSAQYVRCIRDI